MDEAGSYRSQRGGSREVSEAAGRYEGQHEGIGGGGEVQEEAGRFRGQRGGIGGPKE